MHRFRQLDALIVCMLAMRLALHRNLVGVQQAYVRQQHQAGQRMGTTRVYADWGTMELERLAYRAQER